MAQDMTTFAKLSAKLYLNVKVRAFAAGHAQAAFLWVLAITYAVDRRSDGYVEDFALKTFLGGTDDDIAALQEAGFIEPTDGGWMIHDFLKSQVSSGEQDDLRAKRAAAGRIGGRKAGAARTAQASAKQNEAETDIETDIPPIVHPRGRAGRKTQTQTQTRTPTTASRPHGSPTPSTPAPRPGPDASGATRCDRPAPNASRRASTPTPPTSPPTRPTPAGRPRWRTGSAASNGATGRPDPARCACPTTHGSPTTSTRHCSTPASTT